MLRCVFVIFFFLFFSFPSVTSFVRFQCRARIVTVASGTSRFWSENEKKNRVFPISAARRQASFVVSALSRCEVRAHEVPYAPIESHVQTRTRNYLRRHLKSAYASGNGRVARPSQKTLYHSFLFSLISLLNLRIYCLLANRHFLLRSRKSLYKCFVRARHFLRSGFALRYCSVSRCDHDVKNGTQCRLILHKFKARRVVYVTDTVTVVRTGASQTLFNVLLLT